VRCLGRMGVASSGRSCKALPQEVPFQDPWEESTESDSSFDELPDWHGETSSDSLVKAERILAERRNFAGQEDLSTLEASSCVAGHLGAMGRMQDAEAIWRHVVDSYEALLGTDDPKTLLAVFDLAVILKADPEQQEESEALLRRALAARERTPGPEAHITLTTVQLLAEVVEAQGKLLEAEQLYRRAWMGLKAAVGWRHPETMTSESALGCFLSRVHRFGAQQEAGTHLENAWYNQCKVLGPGNPETLASAVALCMLWLKTGRQGESELVLKSILAHRGALTSSTGLEALTTLNNIAALLQAAGRLEEAEEIYRRVVKSRAKTLGDRHPSTLTSSKNLATVLHSKGKYKEAKRRYVQVLEGMEETLGPSHLKTLAAAKSLARLLSAVQKTDEAVRLLKRAAEGEAAALGPGHSQTTSTVRELALKLQCAGRDDESEQVLRLAVKEMDAAQVPGDAMLARNDLAVLLARAGRADEAEEILRRAVKDGQEALGNASPQVLTSLGNLAAVLVGEGKLKEAEPLCRQALVSGRLTLGEGHLTTVNCMSTLGRILMEGDKERRSEAEQLLRSALQSREAILGPYHPDTKASKHFLGLVLQSLGRQREALELLQDVGPAPDEPQAPGSAPGSVPGSVPSSVPGTAPGSAPGSAPNSARQHTLLGLSASVEAWYAEGLGSNSPYSPACSPPQFCTPRSQDI